MKPAPMTPIQRKQLRTLFREFPYTVGELKAAIQEGRIDGGAYYLSAERCGCLIAHLAQMDRLVHTTLETTLDDLYATLATQPVEHLVIHCMPGLTAENDAALAAIMREIERWEARNPDFALLMPKPARSSRTAALSGNLSNA